MEQNEMMSENKLEKTKIKTHFARIVVIGTAEKPYYEILYFNPDDKDYHIGFGSSCLKYVFQWLSEEFEIVDAPQVECEPIRHGQWVWGENGEVSCSECNGLIGVAFADTAYKETVKDHHFCLYCGAKMDLGDSQRKKFV